MTYTKINPELKAKWVEALSSGRYSQGCLLHTDGKFCCLGVLCEVVGTPRVFNQYGGTAYDFGDGKLQNGVPPNGYCGLDQDTIGKCVNLNDAKESFPDIAKWIEENL